MYLSLVNYNSPIHSRLYITADKYRCPYKSSVYKAINPSMSLKQNSCFHVWPKSNFIVLASRTRKIFNLYSSKFNLSFQYNLAGHLPSSSGKICSWIEVYHADKCKYTFEKRAVGFCHQCMPFCLALFLFSPSHWRRT